MKLRKTWMCCVLACLAASGAWALDMSLVKDVEGDKEALAELQSKMAAAQKGAELDKALRAAAYRGLPHTVDWLLSQGADPSAPGSNGVNALMANVLGLKSLVTEYRITKTLLDAGADANAMNVNRHNTLMAFMHSRLDERVERGEPEELPPGWKEVPWKNQGDFKAFESATVDLLVRQTAKLEALDVEGNTALLIAAQKGRFDVVFQLAAAGANLNAADRRGRTAIFWAPTSAIGKLVEAGAQVNWPNADGSTPLHAAMSSLTSRELPGHVKALLAAGAKDSKNRHGVWASEVLHPSFVSDPRSAEVEAVRQCIRATR